MDNASLQALRDPVHGQIRIIDPDFFHAETALLEVLESDQLRRLTRIKQLPFSSTEFIAADHTRFAHALGTAHVMVELLRRLKDTGFFGKRALADLQAIPKVGKGKPSDRLRTIGEHMVFAGLMQDLGELPFKKATDLYLFPHVSLIKSLEDDFGDKVTQIGAKDVLTLHSVRNLLESSPATNERLSFPLLAFLITGVESTAVQSNRTLTALRNLLDGAVDADRLDYVHRDAHHTLGAGFGSTAALVIGSLKTVTPDGPVFSTPNAVSNFTILRAALAFQVYSSPLARFNFTILARVLSKISTQGFRAMDDLFRAPGGALSYDSFVALDDAVFMTQLQRARQMDADLILDPSSVKSIDILTGSRHSYQHYWITKPLAPEGDGDVATSVPNDVFVDTFWDEERHRVYRPKSIHVDAKAYTLGGSAMPLEETGGHISEFLDATWDSTPSRGRVLFFIPEHRSHWFLDNIATPKGRASLHLGALITDAEIRMSASDDTRTRDGFTGPSIFVSFSWKDIHLARAILRMLSQKRRRYFAFVEDFHGLGGDTRENGATYARQAEAGLILLSGSYLERTRDPESNIYAELVALGHTVPSTRIALLAVEGGGQFLEDLRRFPWRLIGRTVAPYLGPALDASNPHLIERAIESMLALIDRASTDDHDRES